ncbi:hypothetical protein EMIHUDRAFT_248929 [Emiliania huxleyi CCMP1516]|uniref:Protein kinase domain-containing protein n=2 Tax=Emiliania huxleyi TaxID=2903 RepID=A0A0D3ICA5_EMIH1|nr:hypothetical protein EMIHUDRAFT_248929 [Emiliania huxleyi CCMP1516]EOD08890.1 hypothetical protein EMIHUDRAFT_248929 [Emiliania huxleyi CCMP1516]|eukprot:XP_005761319.1 hypothetical protein EMIHUDRAFT_248929 [Emiliania huxleyi CCMP1516]
MEASQSSEANTSLLLREATTSISAPAELAVIRLLQGSARSPEDLLFTAHDLLRLGLLTGDTVRALCLSLGLSDEPLAAMLGSHAAAGADPKHTALIAAPSSRLASEFVLLRKLGHGAMGSVFLARHRLDGAQYAVKIVPFFARPSQPAHALAQEAERVLREVQALSRLNHRNVCRYYNAWLRLQRLDHRRLGR